jgi:DNA-binding beta-propeller fold protein YncE
VDYQAHVVVLVDPDTGEKSVLAGSLDSPGYADGTGRDARFDVPYDVVVRPDGDLIVSDHENQRLRRVTLDGKVTTFAGTGAAGTADGPAEEAEFFYPQGLAVASDGTLYVTSTGGYVIRQVTPEGEVSTIAGTGQPGFSDGAGDEAAFFGLEGIACGPNDQYLYVADGNRGGGEDYHRVRRIDLSSL